MIRSLLSSRTLPAHTNYKNPPEASQVKRIPAARCYSLSMLPSRNYFIDTQANHLSAILFPFLLSFSLASTEKLPVDGLSFTSICSIHHIPPFKASPIVGDHSILLCTHSHLPPQPLLKGPTLQTATGANPPNKATPSYVVDCGSRYGTHYLSCVIFVPPTSGHLEEPHLFPFLKTSIST